MILLATNNYSDFNLEDYDILDYLCNYYEKEYYQYIAVKNYVNNVLNQELKVLDYMDYLGYKDFESEFEEYAEDCFYDYDCDIENLCSYLEDVNGFNIYGSLGLWSGKKEIKPTFINNFEMVLSKCCEDCNRIYVDDFGDLVIEAIHHDGTNHFTIRDKDGKPLGMKILKAMGRI